MIPPVFNESWSDEVKTLYRHDMEQYWDKALSIHQWNQYQNQLKIYQSIANKKPNLRILDVGCAQATLALLLAEQGHQVTAVDIRQEFLDYAASRHEFGDIKFVCGNVLQDELDGEFDLIFANQIIEHLVYPLELLTTLKAKLVTGGQLVVTTPSWHYLKNSLPSYSALGNPDDWQHRQFTADGDGHFYAYKKSELMDFFKQAQFTSVQPMMFETPIISGHMKVRYLHSLLPTRFLSGVDSLLRAIPIAKNYLSHQLMVVGEK